MAISGHPRVFATLARRPCCNLRSSFLLHSPKVEHSGFFNAGIAMPITMPQTLHLAPCSRSIRCQSNLTLGVSGEDKMSIKSLTEDAESLILNALKLSFFERLNLAWKIMFPSQKRKSSAAAHIAKQRLKMILFSDRCAVSDEAKRKIVKSIVAALSEFVEIDSQDNVQLSVSADSDLGTVYSVTVPVRRVKPEYQDDDDNTPFITNIEYKDDGETSGSVDVRFDFSIPNERIQ
ncbi:hypothetical protein Drorol1_Dr00018815 [Drosera rotundifolia]